jgi:hypothetical protein
VTSEDESQALADAEEALTEKRYERLQALLDAFEDPIRRADAMSRLEAWLILHPPPRLPGERSTDGPSTPTYHPDQGW